MKLAGQAPAQVVLEAFLKAIIYQKKYSTIALRKMQRKPVGVIYYYWKRILSGCVAALLTSHMPRPIVYFAFLIIRRTEMVSKLPLLDFGSMYTEKQNYKYISRKF